MHGNIRDFSMQSFEAFVKHTKRFIPRGASNANGPLVWQLMIHCNRLLAGVAFGYDEKLAPHSYTLHSRHPAEEHAWRPRQRDRVCPQALYVLDEFLDPLLETMIAAATAAREAAALADPGIPHPWRSPPGTHRMHANTHALIFIHSQLRCRSGDNSFSSASDGEHRIRYCASL